MGKHPFHQLHQRASSAFALKRKILTPVLRQAFFKQFHHFVFILYIFLFQRLIFHFIRLLLFTIICIFSDNTL